jgi:hypothetical protein
MATVASTDHRRHLRTEVYSPIEVVISRIVYWIFGVIEALLALRFVLALFGAAQLDGELTLRAIFDRARHSNAALAGVTDVELLQDFRPVYDLFSGVDGMLLRHRDVPRFPTSGELAQLAFRWQR